MATAKKGKSTSARKKKVKRSFTKGVAHIHATFNNTIVTITDTAGNVIAWQSAGGLGYKGAKESDSAATVGEGVEYIHIQMPPLCHYLVKEPSEFDEIEYFERGETVYLGHKVNRLQIPPEGHEVIPLHLP